MTSTKSRPSMFLVIDDETMLATLRTSLNSCGFRSVGFKTGEAGLACWNKSDYIGVIVNITLPGMSGLEFLSRVKSEKAVVVSGRISAEVGQRLCGKYTYLAKPFGHEELKSALAKAGLLPI